MEQSTHNKIIKGIELLTQDLSQVTKVHNDELYKFDVMSESIVWIDELPAMGGRSPSKIWGLRPLLRYRATLMLGEPAAEWEQYWNLAKTRFPNWIGFREERVHPPVTVIDFLRASLMTGQAVTASVMKKHLKGQ